MSIFTKEIIENSLSYDEYKKLSQELFAQGKSTSKPDEYNTPEYVEYVRVNLQRMNRVEKTTQIKAELQEKLNALKSPQTWIVLSESWCGDAAQNVPALAMIADSSNMVELRILLREENLDVMNAYLTNGGKAIPKMIAIDANTYQELWQWGPRPKAAQELVLTMKANGEDFHIGVHKWYAADKSQTLQTELLSHF